MKLVHYELDAEDSLTVFKFASEGSKGRIMKMVVYSQNHIKGLYNIAFGDLDPETNTINDVSVSNNGDTEKVLATVGATIYIFIEKYKDARIYATGSTKSRNRLYRMKIAKY